MAETVRRTALENALVLYAPLDRQLRAKTNLETMSVDELLVLAEFLGACILTTAAVTIDTWDAIRHRAKAYHRGMYLMNEQQREDAAHKVILVSEFAACCGLAIR